MSIKRLPAKEFLSASAGAIVIDVRSPAEFRHAHMPGAVSIPLFTDEERKIVGTAYKQESREKAIKHGLDFFGPKMRPIVEQVENLIAERKHKTKEQLSANSQQLKTVYLYCWRGGMRSGAIAWLLDLYGFEVYVLAGGYKAYRNLVLKTFEFPYTFKVLGGFTGSGKTELILELKKAGEKIIDLEGIASHKGSAFGNIDMPPQPGQEMFENLLALELLRLTDTSHTREPSTVNREDLATRDLTSHVSRLTTESGSSIWVEDESQRIGLLNLPNALWKTIRESPVFFLDIPFESRLDHITEEYGKLNREKLGDAINRISKRLGPQDTKASLDFLEEGNIKECFRILLKYYDKHYLKALYNREAINRLLTKIPSENVSAGNVNLLTPILHE